ncbi:hypothetical protein V7024_21325 [Bacillus sp. JJ864]|uniref:hypothetical protein n=1 Tax=Bacillus sp. JJ864 TaxID=3122975 RepID=UPI003000D231
MVETNSFNTANLSKITSKKLPYEVIPRELLQAPEHIDMSLEALGLLLNLKSYKDDWIIRKTELYHRYPFNKEKSIRKCWKELEECNYAKEIKVREGSKYTHHYFFDIVPFDSNSISIPESGSMASFIGNQFHLPNNSVQYNNRFEDAFEMLPRELLQSKDLSLQAIGLLCHLISYPESYQLQRKELYSRFKKNKRVSVNTILEELIENRYFLQFKKRNGKKDDTRYFYRTTPFSDNEINEIESIIETKNVVSFALGKRKTDTDKKVGTSKSTPQTKKEEKVGTSKSTPQETALNQGILECRKGSAENEVLNLECSEGRTIRIHSEKNTQLNNTHIDNTQLNTSSSLIEKISNNTAQNEIVFTKEEEEYIKHIYSVLKDKLITSQIFTTDNQINETIKLILKKDIFYFDEVDIEQAIIHYKQKCMQQYIAIPPLFFANGFEICLNLRHSSSIAVKESERILAEKPKFNNYVNFQNEKGEYTGLEVFKRILES